MSVRIGMHHRRLGGLSRALAATLAMSLASTTVVPAFAQTPSKSLPITRSEYEACQTQDEAQFRKAIEAITLAALKQGTGRIDYRAIVRDEWRRQEFNSLIDARVDIAVLAVRKETSWGKLLKSLAYRDKAKELATAVAERVYRSDAIKEGLDKLAHGVGVQIGRSIELTASDAALPAQKCLRAFIGPRYGEAVARSVTQDASAAFKVDAKDNQASISTGAVVREASGGLAGVVVILIRRQMARMAERLGQRLAGAVLSRLVSMVATGIGLVLIAKDVWDFRYGVMPIIATEMKSEDTKTRVQRELATGIETQISEQMTILAGQTADQILDIWKSFRRNHAEALGLAEKDPEFRRFLDSARPDQLARLDEIVGLSLGEGGESHVLKRLADGSLGRALETLPEEGLQIARELRSLDKALAWDALAGDGIRDVRKYELHRIAKPADFTNVSLTRLLKLDDPVAIPRLAAVTPGARTVLFELPDKELISLARHLTTAELDTLSSYLTGLSREASRRVLKAVAQTPARMRILAIARVRDAVIASRDQVAAVEMMLRADTGLDLAQVANDVREVAAGRVHPILLWDRHPIVLIGAGVVLLLFLLILRRLFSTGRRPPSGRDAAKTAPPREPPSGAEA